MINKNPTSGANAPRGIVHINGIPIIWNSFEVNTQNYYQADTFRLSIPLTGQPNGIDVEYWLSQPAILVEIFAGFPANPDQFNESELMSLIVGAAEPVKTKKVQANVIVSGRDLTSKFIDNKTFEKYPNNSFTQIATKLAVKEGLQISIKSPTNTRVGTYYDVDYVQNLDVQTPEWDLLTYLAQKENYLIYVKGTTLYCEPLPDENSDPYVINYINDPNGGPPSGNFIDISVDRDLTRARDIIVEVRSHNLRTGKPVTIRVTATHNKNTVISGKAQPIGDAQVFSYVETNLTPAQALAFAQNKIHQISMTERVLFFTDYANNELQKSSVIKLAGYSPSADQIYYPDSITRTMIAGSDGYKMQVRAKNHSPNSVKPIQ